MDVAFVDGAGAVLGALTEEAMEFPSLAAPGVSSESLAQLASAAMTKHTAAGRT